MQAVKECVFIRSGLCKGMYRHKLKHAHTHTHIQVPVNRTRSHKADSSQQELHQIQTHILTVTVCHWLMIANINAHHRGMHTYRYWHVNNEAYTHNCCLLHRWFIARCLYAVHYCFFTQRRTVCVFSLYRIERTAAAKNHEWNSNRDKYTGSHVINPSCFLCLYTMH